MMLNSSKIEEKGHIYLKLFFDAVMIGKKQLSKISLLHPFTTRQIEEFDNNVWTSWDIKFRTKGYHRKKKATIFFKVVDVSNKDVYESSRKLLHESDTVLLKICQSSGPTSEGDEEDSIIHDENISMGSLSNISYGTLDTKLTHVSLLHEIGIQHLELKHYMHNEYKIIWHRDKKKKKIFHVYFTNEDEGKKFFSRFEEYKDKIIDRVSALARRHSLKSGVKQTFILDIISAKNLKAVNVVKGNSDPFCVFFTDKEIHRTKPIYNCLNPIWTYTTGSLTLFTTSPDEISTHGLSFEVYDWERVTKNRLLGRAKVYAETFYTSQNERLELELDSPFTNESKKPFLYVKFREATTEDINFMNRNKEYFEEQTCIKNNLKPPRDFAQPTQAKLLSQPHIINKKHDSEGNKLYRVSPRCDPENPDKTTWLKKDEIEKASMEPSHQWVQVGAGTLGYLFVEVIGCDDIHDRGVIQKVATKVDEVDPYIAIVYEDTFVTTEVVDNCKRPRFMPWTRRAFVFNITTSSSVLNLALLDYNRNRDDTKIGRVTVPLNSFRANTQHVLYYNLYESARFFPRFHKGTIKLRLSIEWHDPRIPFRCIFQPYNRFHTNCETHSQLNHARFAVEGKPDMQNYSVDIIQSTIEELLKYINDILDIPKSMWNVFYWRNSHTVYITEKIQFEIPLRSIIFYIWGILFVERPILIPSLISGALGWIMIICLENRCKYGHRWNRPRTYPQLLRLFLFGIESRSIIKKIDRDETVHLFSTDEISSIKEATDLQWERLYENFRETNELNELNADEFAAENLLSEKKKMVPQMQLLKSIFYPWQQTLQFLCGQIRYLKRILNWDRCFISFWITTGCFLSSFIFYFIPWPFLIKWTARIIVWVFFSPLMKIVDKFQHSEEVGESNFLKARRKEVAINIENMVKLKDFKRFLFGNYILTMPHFLQPDRYVDMPLPWSSAKPFQEHELMSKKIGTPVQILGGKLDVDMTPTSSYVARNKITSSDKKLKKYFGLIKGVNAFNSVLKQDA